MSLAPSFLGHSRKYSAFVILVFVYTRILLVLSVICYRSNHLAPRCLTCIDNSLFCFWDPCKITLGTFMQNDISGFSVTMPSSVKPVHFKNIFDLYNVFFSKSNFVNVYGPPYTWVYICRLKSGLGHFRWVTENSVIICRTIVFLFPVILFHTFLSRNFIICFPFAWFVHSYTSVTCHCWPLRPWILYHHRIISVH